MNYPWQATVQDDAGNAVVNPVVTVWEADGVTLATIYDVTGAVIPNPITGSLEGFVQFWAAAGSYIIEGAKAGEETEPWYVIIGGVDAGSILVGAAVTVSGIDIRGTTDMITTSGYHSDGDGGAASYRRVAVEPVHAGKLQSADGAWWELVAENPSLRVFGGRRAGLPSENSDAMDKAIGYLAYSGGGYVSIGAGIWGFSRQWVLESKTGVVGSGRITTICQFTNSNGVTTADTDDLFSTNSPSGSSYWYVKSLTLYGSSDTDSTSGNGVYTYSRAYILEDVSISYFAEKGINSKWYTGAAWDDPDAWRNDLFMESRLTNIDVSYCGQEGIIWDGPHDSQWSNVIVGLCSWSDQGNYSGITILDRSGGLQAQNCHSWGDYHYYAWDIRAGHCMFENCEADDAYFGLIYIGGSDVSWNGGIQFGAVFNDPPLPHDRTLRGVVIGTSGTGHSNLNINTVVKNCPGGGVCFYGDMDSFNNINIIGSILPSIASGSKGWDGTTPAFADVRVSISGAAIQASLRRNNSQAEVMPQLPSNPTATWVNGMFYYNNTSNSIMAFVNGSWKTVSVT